MPTTANQEIHRLLFERLYQIRDEIMVPDPEFKRLGEKSYILYKMLIAKLSQEQERLLDEYEDSRAEQVNREDEIMYTRGFIDGIRCGCLVERISRGVGEVEV